VDLLVVATYIVYPPSLLKIGLAYVHRFLVIVWVVMGKMKCFMSTLKNRDGDCVIWIIYLYALLIIALAYRECHPDAVAIYALDLVPHDNKEHEI